MRRGENEKNQEFSAACARRDDLADMHAASMRACAAAAASSAKVPSIDGLALPAANSGSVALHGLPNRRFLRDGTRAQRGAGMGETLEHAAAEINGRLRARLEGDLHHASFDRRSFARHRRIVGLAGQIFPNCRSPV
jgi:hypothetical protein